MRRSKRKIQRLALLHRDVVQLTAPLLPLVDSATHPDHLLITARLSFFLPLSHSTFSVLLFYTKQDSYCSSAASERSHHCTSGLGLINRPHDKPTPLWTSYHLNVHIILIVHDDEMYFKKTPSLQPACTILRSNYSGGINCTIHKPTLTPFKSPSLIPRLSIVLLANENDSIYSVIYFLATN